MRRRLLLFWWVLLLLPTAPVMMGNSCFYSPTIPGPPPEPIVLEPDAGADTSADAGETPDVGVDAVRFLTGCDAGCTTDVPCKVAACVDGVCALTSAAAGAPCDDGVACTEADRCADGTCIGVRRYGAVYNRDIAGLYIEPASPTCDTLPVLPSSSESFGLNPQFQWPWTFRWDGDDVIVTTPAMRRVRVPINGDAPVLENQTLLHGQLATATRGADATLYTGVFGLHEDSCVRRTHVEWVPKQGASVLRTLTAPGGFEILAAAAMADGFLLAGRRRQSPTAPVRHVLVRIHGDGSLGAITDGPVQVDDRGAAVGMHLRADGDIAIHCASGLEVLTPSGERRWGLNFGLAWTMPNAVGPYLIQRSDAATPDFIIPSERCRVAAKSGKIMSCVPMNTFTLTARRLPDGDVITTSGGQITVVTGWPTWKTATRIVARLDPFGNERWRTETPGATPSALLDVDETGRSALFWRLENGEFHLLRLDAHGNHDCEGACDLPGAVTCDDGDVCTTDRCLAGGCVHAPADGACFDGDVCKGFGSCTGGACVATTTTACPAGDACQVAACVPGYGCSLDAAPAGTTCDDGNGCTVNDACNKPTGGGAACQGLPAAASPCDDGDACTGPDTCGASGVCKGGSLACDDNEPCTADVCALPAGVCVHTPLPGVCGTPTGCDVGMCTQGKCVMGPVTPRFVSQAANSGVQQFEALVTMGSTEVAVGRQASQAGYRGAIVRVSGVTGAVLGSEAIGSAGSGLYGVVPRGSGALAVGGGTGAQQNGQLWLVELTDKGAVGAEHLLGGANHESAFAVATSPQGYVVVGQEVPAPGGAPSGWVGFISPTLQLTATQTHGSVGADQLRAVAVGPGGTLVAAGATLGVRPWLIGMDATGKLLWQQTFEQLGSGVLRGVATVGSDLFAVGQVSLKGAPSDGLFVRFTASGTVAYANAPATPGWDELHGVAARPDGGLLVVGSRPAPGGNVSSSGRPYWAAFDLFGNTQWERWFGGASYGALKAVSVSAGGGARLVGESITQASENDLLLLAVGPFGYTSCAAAGACGTQLAGGCDDKLPCTADDCLPASGCAHASLSIGAACGAGKACDATAACSP